MAPSERLLKDRAHPRHNMINCQLRPSGVTDERLLAAFASVPMESFVPPAVQSLVYSDADLPLTPELQSKRWLLAPLTLGMLLQLATIQSIDRVLIVACGTGYTIALVAQLAAHVVGVESHENLAFHARAYAAEQEIFNIQVVTGALSVGYPKEAPYDVILIEGAVDKIPLILMQQLSPHNGRLVTVIKGQTGSGQIEFGKGVLITRIDDKVNQVAKFDVSCPQLTEFERERGFRL